MSKFIKLACPHEGTQYINFNLVESFEPAPEKDPQPGWEARTNENPDGVVGTWIYFKSADCAEFKVLDTPEEILVMLEK